MTLTDYLKSEQSKQDAAELLKIVPDQHGRCFTNPPAPWWWSIRKGRAWTAIGVGPADEDAPSAYFRPDGDRFVVSDLGEAVRTLRLRTGCTAPMEMRFQPLPDGLNSWEQVMVRGVLAPDLPRAICRVLLAAHVVAGMEV